jgi:hypothetical protein
VEDCPTLSAALPWDWVEALLLPRKKQEISNPACKNRLVSTKKHATREKMLLYTQSF